MKKPFQILFLFLLPFSAFAQENKDTVSTNGRKWNKVIFIAGGINATQYYNDAFIKYLFDSTYSSKPSPISGYSVYFGNTVPDKFNYSKSSNGPFIGLGLELYTSKLKKVKFHHIIEANYMRFYGDYSYSVSYTEGRGGSPPAWVDIIDTVLSKYRQTIFSLCYKVQPTYKFVFLSFGINCSLNLLEVDQKKKEQRDDYYVDEWTMQTIHSYSGSSTFDTKNNLHFVNVPIQFGAGCYIKIKRVVLKPAFYFIPYWYVGLENERPKGYRLYTFSLGIGYSLKKQNCCT